MTFWDFSIAHWITHYLKSISCLCRRTARYGDSITTPRLNNGYNRIVSFDLTSNKSWHSIKSRELIIAENIHRHAVV